MTLVYRVHGFNLEEWFLVVQMVGESRWKISKVVEAEWLQRTMPLRIKSDGNPSKSTGFQRIASAYEFQQIRDGSMGFDRVSELRPFPNHVVVASAYTLSLHYLGFLELGNDLLDGSLGDSDLDRHFPQQYIRIAV